MPKAISKDMLIRNSEKRTGGNPAHDSRRNIVAVYEGDEARRYYKAHGMLSLEDLKKVKKKDGEPFQIEKVTVYAPIKRRNKATVLGRGKQVNGVRMGSGNFSD